MARCVEQSIPVSTPRTSRVVCAQIAVGLARQAVAIDEVASTVTPGTRQAIAARAAIRFACRKCARPRRTCAISVHVDISNVRTWGTIVARVGKETVQISTRCARRLVNTRVTIRATCFANAVLQEKPSLASGTGCVVVARGAIRTACDARVIVKIKSTLA